MPTDLTIYGSTFTRLAMLLQYKEGISKQWIEKLVKNTGFNRWFPGRISDQLSLGSNPAPSGDPEDQGGSHCLIWHRSTDNLDHIADASMDWQDRYLMFIGTVTDDSSQTWEWGSSGMNQPDSYYVRADDPNDPVHHSGGSLYGLAIGGGYVGQGDSGAIPAGQTFQILFRSPAPATLSWNVGCDSDNGDLLVRANGSVTNERLLMGLMFYSAQTGYRDDNT